MAQPVRFPSGVSTYSAKSIFQNYPSVATPVQMVSSNDFAPYLGTTAFTFTQSNGTAAVTSWPGGVVKLATTTGAADKAILALGASGNSALSTMMIPGNQAWFNLDLAVAASTVNDATATVLRWGLFDVADISGTITNGIYFEKATNSSGRVDLIIKNNSSGSVVTTTIQKISDLTVPSGIYGDTSSTAGTLTTNGSAGVYNSIVVGTPGSGYAQAPLVLATGATGSGSQLYCQLGSGSLYAPYVLTGGSSYTTYVNEVDPWQQYSLWWDGKDTLKVGVNGKIVATIGPQGVTGLAAGGTADATATGPSYYSTSTLSTGVAPIQPKAGSAYTIIPKIPLTAAVGIINASGAGRAIYIDDLVVACETN